MFTLNFLEISTLQVNNFNFFNNYISNITFLNLFFLFFIALVVCSLWAKHLTYKGLQIILISFSFLLFIYSILNWRWYVLEFTTENFNCKFNVNNWININYEICFKLNTLSFLFILLVITIGFSTNIYMISYFKFEERAEEFILLINWFMWSMIFLLLSNNFFTIILGWELIGLTSFMLINFWRSKITTLNFSFKAFTFNKISDIFLFISFCLLWNYYKINNVDVLLTVINIECINQNKILSFSVICLIICSFIKSAQFIGHLWLPDSMEAPVPASSLIHSATLVSAGIFLLLKFNTLIRICNYENLIICWGSFTACYGSIVAASQSDMKKLLAYSTISHCGYIIVSIVLNNFFLTIIYLFLHGLFKAVTFFCAGSIIKLNNNQDTRYMGNLKNYLMFGLMLTVSSINLGGLPFTLGYLYKDLFLTVLIIKNVNSLNYGFCIIGFLCSIVYVYKLIYYSCFDFRKGELNIIPIILQNYEKLYNKYFLTFNYMEIIAFLLIHVFSLLYYIIVKFYFFDNYIILINSVQFFTFEISYLDYYLKIKELSVEIFYILFVLVILLLSTVTNRTNYYYQFSRGLRSLLITFLIFWNIYNNLFARFYTLYYYYYNDKINNWNFFKYFYYLNFF